MTPVPPEDRNGTQWVRLLAAGGAVIVLALGLWLGRAEPDDTVKKQVTAPTAAPPAAATIAPATSKQPRHDEPQRKTTRPAIPAVIPAASAPTKTPVGRLSGPVVRPKSIGETIAKYGATNLGLPAVISSRLKMAPPPEVYVLLDKKLGGASRDELEAYVKADLPGPLALKLTVSEWLDEQMGKVTTQVAPSPAIPQKRWRPLNRGGLRALGAGADAG